VQNDAGEVAAETFLNEGGAHAYNAVARASLILNTIGGYEFHHDRRSVTNKGYGPDYSVLVLYLRNRNVQAFLRVR
jgi:hypothetical protein